MAAIFVFVLSNNHNISFHLIVVKYLIKKKCIKCCWAKSELIFLLSYLLFVVIACIFILVPSVALGASIQHFEMFEI